MYLRFVSKRQDPNSGFLQGVIHAAHTLREADRLDSFAEAWLQCEFDWFNQNLRVPSVLSDWENRRGISWLASDATEHIARMRSIAALVRENGVAVRVLKSRDPGLVIYRDKFQVVAKPRHRRIGRRAIPRARLADACQHCVTAR